ATGRMRRPCYPRCMRIYGDRSSAGSISAEQRMSLAGRRSTTSISSSMRLERKCAGQSLITGSRHNRRVLLPVGGIEGLKAPRTLIAALPELADQVYEPDDAFSRQHAIRVLNLTERLLRCVVEVNEGNPRNRIIAKRLT